MLKRLRSIPHTNIQKRVETQKLRSLPFTTKLSDVGESQGVDMPAKVFVIEEGTVNFIGNPVVEANVNKWTTLSEGLAASGVVGTRELGGNFDTDAYYKLEADGVSGNVQGFLINGELKDSGATKVACSIELEVQPAGMEVYFRLSEGEFGHQDGITFVSTGEKQRITYVHTVVNVAFGWQPYLGVTVNNLLPANNKKPFTIKATKAQVENKAQVTSFTEGSMGSGYSWQGLPNESPSEREPGQIVVPFTDVPVFMYYRFSADGEIWQTLTSTLAGVDNLIAGTVEIVGSSLVVNPITTLYLGTAMSFSRVLTSEEIALLDNTPLEYISNKTLLHLPDATVGVSRLL